MRWHHDWLITNYTNEKWLFAFFFRELLSLSNLSARVAIFRLTETNKLLPALKLKYGWVFGKCTFLLVPENNTYSVSFIYFCVLDNDRWCDNPSDTHNPPFLRIENSRCRNVLSDSGQWESKCNERQMRVICWAIESFLWNNFARNRARWECLSMNSSWDIRVPIEWLCNIMHAFKHDSGFGRTDFLHNCSIWIMGFKIEFILIGEAIPFFAMIWITMATRIAELNHPNGMNYVVYMLSSQ